jgi:hypothetical protein
MGHPPIPFTSNSDSEVNYTGVLADTARARTLSIRARDFDRYYFTVLLAAQVLQA